jgi:hypothetical protein
MIKVLKIKKFIFTVSMIFFCIFYIAFFISAPIYAATEVQTTGAGLVSKIAPGEFLPFSVKLLNFGGDKKVDVIVTYTITGIDGKIIYSANETVAVQTTATFVKTIQIPFETSPGRYIVRSSIVYKDQITPATTEFPFMVERKIFGLFQSVFFFYVGGILIASILVVLFGYIFMKRHGTARFIPLDYSNIPHDKRIFFEILSDIIMQMRQRVGDNALYIASHIDGLKINKETGRIIEITGPPSKVIALLVSEYEKTLGKKVSFSFRQEKQDYKSR